ncbi:B3/4 domain-containing protein [Candidatus Bipolaricaulota bacterium]
MRFRIDPAVLEKFPELTIGIVMVHGIDNREPRTGAFAFLEEQVERVRETWSLERLDDDARILAWRDAYRAFGAKPKKHRSSVENLIRMVINGVTVPSINTAVDVYNAISLKYAVPIGGDDLDRVVGDIRLTVATSEERFIPLNGSEAVAPKPGEIIYRDDEDVLCRRWNWRECDKSKMTEASMNLCLVVEGLPPFTANDVGKIASELAEVIEAFCGGRTAAHILDRDVSEVECI